MVKQSIQFTMGNEVRAIETKLAKMYQIKLGMMQTLLTGRTRLVCVSC